MLSRRAKEKNAWFLKAFERPLQRAAEPSGNIIDLATAENWCIRQELLVLLKKTYRECFWAQDFSYAAGLGGAPALLTSLASFLNAYFEPFSEVKPDHIVAGAGVSGLLASLIHDICDDGDALLVSGPFWGSFQISAYFRNSVKLVPVQVPFEYSVSPEAVVAAYRKAARQAETTLDDGCRVRGILFCNPHNPHGHLCPPKVVDGLLRLCEENDLHFISDEVYAQSTFGSPGKTRTGYTAKMKLEPLVERGRALKSPTRKFTSVLAKDLQSLGVSASRVHMLYSISKDLGCSGLRLGCLVTQSNKELRRSQGILNNSALCTAAASMIAPVLADIERIGALMALNITRLRGGASIVVEFAEFHGLTYYEPAAGLYIWLRLAQERDGGGGGGGGGGDGRVGSRGASRGTTTTITTTTTTTTTASSDGTTVDNTAFAGLESTADEEEAIVRACAKAGVAVGSGADYGEKQAGWFRLVFSLPEEQLLEALGRIEEALKYKERFSARARRSSFLRRLRGCP